MFKIIIVVLEYRENRELLNLPPQNVLGELSPPFYGCIGASTDGATYIISTA